MCISVDTYIQLKAYYCTLLSSRIMVVVRVRFNVCLVSGYAHAFIQIFPFLFFTVRDWWSGVAWAGHVIWDSRCYRCCAQQSCRTCYFLSFLSLVHASLSLCLHFISASTSACCRWRLTGMTFVNFLFTCLRNCALKRTHACTVVQSMRNSTGCLRFN